MIALAVTCHTIWHLIHVEETLVLRCLSPHKILPTWILLVFYSAGIFISRYLNSLRLHFTKITTIPFKKKKRYFESS